MSLLDLVLLALGLGLLLVGAEALVRGASGVAGRLGIPPLVVGLTVVAFGTSSPEFAVSLRSTLDGQTGLAVGNVVGSNIFNVLFILGISALITPLAVSRQLVRVDVPVMIAASVAVWVMAMNGTLGRVEGGILAAGLLAYLVLQVYLGMREGGLETPKPGQEASGARGGVEGGGRHPATAPGKTSRPLEGSGAPGPGPGSGEETEAPEGERRPVEGAATAALPLGVQLLLVVGGLGMLVLGARWLVVGAVEIATALGVSDLVIGLTVVAVGTSLPEVATSVLASLRGERDIAVGNVVGSNLFNLLGVLGFTAALAPGGLPVPSAAPGFDLPFMTAAAVACLPIFITGLAIARWEGAVFLGYYLAYTAYLVLRATEHDALPLVSGVMFLFAVPLTLLVLGSALLQGRRRRLSELDSGKPPPVA